MKQVRKNTEKSDFICIPILCAMEGEVKMFRKLTAIFIVAVITVSGIVYCSATNESGYEWAAESLAYCNEHNIINGDNYGNLNLGENLTRAQMAKILTTAFNLSDAGEVPSDMKNHWAGKYAAIISQYMPRAMSSFNGDEYVMREEFAATMVRASGLTAGNIRNSRILDVNFFDAAEVSDDYKTLLCIAVERAYMKGDNGKIRPKDLLTRAEVAVLVARVCQNNSGEKTLTWEDLGVNKSYTSLIGEAQITVEQAQAWAKAKGAAQIFIDIAPTYWKYGELFGLRPEILYAQAAKETGYGKFGGAVTADMNNWAGIKIKSPIGDRKEDHESFATPDDGVRAHFNHMSAYVGLKPIGDVHDRFYVVNSISWAGSVKNLEALGGRWCPDLYYGYSILHDCLEVMSQY